MSPLNGWACTWCTPPHPVLPLMLHCSNIVELAAHVMWEGLCKLWGADPHWRQGRGAASRAPCAPAPAAADRPAFDPSCSPTADWPYKNVTHVEWWAHTRPPGAYGHQLHFDCDETRLRKVRGFRELLWQGVLLWRAWSSRRVAPSLGLK